MLLGSSPTESWLSGRLHRKSLLLRPPLQDRRWGGQWIEILHAETFTLSFLLTMFLLSVCRYSRDLAVTLVSVFITLSDKGKRLYSRAYSKMPVNLYINYLSEWFGSPSQSHAVLFNQRISEKLLTPGFWKHELNDFWKQPCSERQQLK